MYCWNHQHKKTILATKQYVLVNYYSYKIYYCLITGEYCNITSKSKVSYLSKTFHIGKAHIVHFVLKTDNLFSVVIFCSDVLMFWGVGRVSKENNCKECVGNFWNGFDKLTVRRSSP